MFLPQSHCSPPAPGGLRLTLEPLLPGTKSALSIPASGIEPAEQPLSREDALTERLRSLRNRRDRLASSGDSGDLPPPPPYTASPPPSATTRAQPPPPPSSSARATGVEAGSSSRRSGEEGGDDGVAEGSSSQSSGEYDDYFDDDVLQPLDLEDDHDEDGSDSEDGEGSSKRVEDLLAKLKADPGAQPPPLPAAAEGKPAAKGGTSGDDSDDDDDSEGEVMSREVENVISRAMDELNLDGPASSHQPGEPEPGDNPELALPTVPQDAADNNNNEEHDASPKSAHQTGGNNDGEAGAGLSLPTVPTDLTDPAPTSGRVVPSGGSDGDPFETSIEARLAALKGGGAPIIHTDSLGLPSAPTFRPEDNRPAPRLGRAGTGGGGRAGYTDADQKTWCIVCLEDGTIRCLGCDDDGGGGDVYCARCWKEMHVGPAAGYDERGHAWERFDPRRV